MSESKREFLAGNKDQAYPAYSARGQHIELPDAHARPLTGRAATASGLRAKQNGQDPFREIDRLVAKSW